MYQYEQAHRMHNEMKYEIFHNDEIFPRSVLCTCSTIPNK